MRSTDVMAIFVLAVLSAVLCAALLVGDVVAPLIVRWIDRRFAREAGRA